MIECEETFTYEDENEIMEENDLIEEIEEMQIQTPSTRQERISARKEKRESAKKESGIRVNNIPKKNLGDIEEESDQLRCVEVESSVFNMSESIENYYKNAEDVEEKEESYDKDKLKDIIKMFLMVDDQCSELTAKAKDLREEKKQYEEYILTYMEDTQKKEISECGVKLNKQVKERKQKPKEEDVYKTLAEVFKDEDVARKVTEKIYESMPMVEDVKLVKDDPKAKKTTKKTVKKVKK